MAIADFSADVEVIQKLDTMPNQEGGLSAEELKAKFDEAAVAIKQFINNTLLPVVRELEDAKNPAVIYGLDQTLSELGRAADAKAVGDALAQKVGKQDTIDLAHGGTGGTTAEEARNNLGAAQTEHSHEASDIASGLIPLERGGTGAGTAEQAMKNLGITEALAEKAPAIESADHHGCYYRIVDGETEWLNPPMIFGVEYRTTERWNGAPIYAKQINMGVIPDNSTLSVEHGAEDDKIIEIKVMRINPADDICVQLPSFTSGTGAIEAFAYAYLGKINVCALNTSGGKYRAYAVIKYLK